MLVSVTEAFLGALILWSLGFIFTWGLMDLSAKVIGAIFRLFRNNKRYKEIQKQNEKS